MTIKIVDTTASYKSAPGSALKLPVSMTSLAFVHLFGGTLAQSLQNWAPGQGSAVVTGATPTFDTQSLTTQSGASAPSYLTTVMADSNAITLISVSRELTNPTNGGVMIGNGTSSYLTNLAWFPDTTGYVYLNGVRGGNNEITSDAVALNTYKCVSMRQDNADGNGYVVNHTDSVSMSWNLNYPTLGSPMLIGANYNSAFVGQIQHLLAIGFNRRLTSAEIATMYTWCQQYCAQLPSPVTV